MTDFSERMADEHYRARLSPDHVIDGLIAEPVADVETCSNGGRYIRLCLSPTSHTIDGWIAINLHDDDAARIIAELGKALSDVLFSRAVGDGTIHEL